MQIPYNMNKIVWILFLKALKTQYYEKFKRPWFDFDVSQFVVCTLE